MRQFAKVGKGESLSLYLVCDDDDKHIKIHVLRWIMSRSDSEIISPKSRLNREGEEAGGGRGRRREGGPHKGQGLKIGLNFISCAK